MTEALDIAFLALGEPHQLFHILGPAVALANKGHAVTLFVATVWHEQIIARHAPGARLTVRRIRTLLRADPPIYKTPNRIISLLLNGDHVTKFDILVTPERSSTVLKRIGAFSGMMAHLPHGAGDRAASYDSRIKLFDLVIAPGEKDRRRFISRGLVQEDRCVTAGYAKFDLIGGALPRFFDNEKPIVLYNPHFDKELSSWPGMGADLIRAFAAETRFNFIIAPHIRLRGAMRRSFEALASRNRAGHVRFDSGSLHSINMDYTRAAAIYLGDVSSQVYEFIHTPRPCVFLNPRNTAWQNDEHYWHWRYGPVAVTVDGAMRALSVATATQEKYEAVQREGFETAIAQPGLSASEEIAAALERGYHVWCKNYPA